MSIDADVKREAKNARARIDTRIKNINRELEKAGVAATRYGRELKATIKRLETMREETKVIKADKTKRTEREIRENIKRTESLAPSMQTFRKNIQTMEEMNKPFRKDAVLGKYNEAQVRAFFAATIRAWHGEYYGNRIARIMEYYGVSDLSKLIDAVLLLVLKKIDVDESAEGENALITFLDFQDKSAEDSEDSERKGSPPTGKEIMEIAERLSMDDIIETYEQLS